LWRADLADQGGLVRGRIDPGAWNDASLRWLVEPVRAPEADLPGGVRVGMDIHHAHSRITGRFQPPGDSYYPSHMAGVSAGTGHPGDDRGLQPVDRVGADTQQARALGVQPGDGAGPLEYVVGIVHPRMDRRVPADMPSR
jgi:hypothetical protein